MIGGLFNFINKKISEQRKKIFFDKDRKPKKFKRVLEALVIASFSALILFFIPYAYDN